MYQLPFNQINKDEFLAKYWQKAPCLFKGAFPSPPGFISADELAGLSMEQEVESRLIIKDDNKWTIDHGPFEESRFSMLPERDWTLLVQSVDLHHPQVHGLMSDFNFLPRWRYDDIMISFATDGGGVGPHTDNYDVFLIQTEGQRRWQVGCKGEQHTAQTVIAGMSHVSPFKPIIDIVMEPGDMLYIPPDTAHWGTSIDQSIGYSVGFRNPQNHQLLALITEDLAETTDKSQFFTDDYRTSSLHFNQLEPELISWAQQELIKLSKQPEKLSELLGKQLSLSKSEINHINIDNNQKLTSDSSIELYDCFSVNWHQNDKEILLYIEGDTFQFPLETLNAIKKLANYQTVAINLFNTSPKPFDFIQVLTKLLIRGYIKQN